MIADKLAQYIFDTNYDDLPDQVIAQTKNCIIDWFGNAAIGSSYPQAEKLLAVIEDQADGPVSLVGRPQKASSLMAALFNGVSSHTVELDDLHRRTQLHPGTAVIAAALAAAEMAGTGGRELITAVALGYDVTIRVAEAVGPSHLEFWYPTGTCGVFGAAAAACKVLALEPDQIVDALGNAGTQAGGLWEFHRDKAMSKQLHAGKAAFSGILSAGLAGRGFTGAASIFEGPSGFLKAFSQQPRLPLLEKGLGEQFKILEISFKLYPSGRHTHGGIDLAMRLRDRGVQASEIELLRIKTYRQAHKLVGNPNPETPDEAKFSLPFCVATTLVRGMPTLECFCREQIEDPQVRRLLTHTTVEIDSELDLLYPEHWPVAIELIDSNSHIIREQTEYPKGDPENPTTPKEIHDKFIVVAGRVFGPEKARQLLDKLLELEKITDMRALL